MEAYFIDSNILLRFLLKDHKKHYSLSKAIFKKAEASKIRVIISEVVILETIWTLRSFYKYAKQDIRDKIEAITAAPFVEVKNQKLIISSLHHFATTNVDFADAYIYEQAKLEKKKILTFDNDFKKLGSTANIEKVVR